MSEEQKNEEQKDTLREQLEAKNKALANGLQSEIQISQTEEQLSHELETTPEQKQKIMEDIKDELYTKNKYDYSLENELDDDEQRKHRLEVLIQSLPEEVNDIQVLKLIKGLCKYKDSFDDLKRDIQYYIEYGNLSEARQERFEDWYTQVDHLFLYEGKAVIKEIEHTGAKELWKQIKMSGCTDETMTHIFDWAESYGIDIPDYTTAENISYTGDYHNLEKAYEIDFVVTWLLSLPWSHHQRTQLEGLKKSFPDPLLREILVVAEEEVLHQGGTSTESVGAMAKFATLWVLFRDKIDLSVMTDFHVRQCARLIRDGKDTESIIQNLLNYLGPIERDYEDFDNLVETLQRMQEVFDEKKKQRRTRLIKRKYSDLLSESDVNQKTYERDLEKLKKENVSLSDEMELQYHHTYYVPGGNKIDPGKLEQLHENTKKIESIQSKLKEIRNNNLLIRTGIMRTSEEQKEIDKVDTKINQIEFFFKNLKNEILIGRDFSIGVVRSLPKDPNAGKLVKEDGRGGMFEWFEVLRAKEIGERFKSYFPNYAIKKDNAIDEEIKEYFINRNIDPSIAETKIDLDASSFEEEYLKEAILDFSKFGLGENVEFSIDGYPQNVSSELILNVIFYELKNRYEESGYLDGLNGVSHIKYDLFLHMLELGDTTFVESKMWEEKRGERLYCDYKNDRKNYGSRLNLIRKIAMKEGYDDVVSSMLQGVEQGGELLRYYWQRNKDWLKEDFTSEKFEILQKHFVIIDGVLVHKEDEKVFREYFSSGSSDGFEGLKNNRDKIKDVSTVNLNDIDGKPITYYLTKNNDISILNQWLDLIMEHFSVDKQFVASELTHDRVEHWKQEILHTPMMSSLLNCNLISFSEIGEKVIHKEKRSIKRYEILKKNFVEGKDGYVEWQGEKKKEIKLRSLVHMCAELGNERDVRSSIRYLEYFLVEYENGFVEDGGTMKFKRLAEVMQHKNPETGLNGLQTLAEYGYIGLVEELMSKYKFEVWGGEEPEKIMNLIAQSEVASIEVYERFYKEYIEGQEFKLCHYVFTDGEYTDERPVPKGEYIHYILENDYNPLKKILYYDVVNRKYLYWEGVKKTNLKARGGGETKEYWLRGEKQTFECPLHPSQKYIGEIKKSPLYPSQEHLNHMKENQHSPYEITAGTISPFPLLHEHGKHLLAAINSGNVNKLDHILSQGDYIPTKNPPDEISKLVTDAKLAKNSDEHIVCTQMISTLLKHCQKSQGVSYKLLDYLLDAFVELHLDKYTYRKDMYVAIIDSIYNCDLLDVYRNNPYKLQTVGAAERNIIIEEIKSIKDKVANKEMYDQLFGWMFEG